MVLPSEGQLAILVLILCSTFGIGMISASSFYLFNFKQNTEPVRFILQDIVVALTAGYYYPLTVLPDCAGFLHNEGESNRVSLPACGTDENRN